MGNLMEEGGVRDMTPRLILDLGLRFIPKGDRRRTYGLYECQYCGKGFECVSQSINSGNTKSCGCLNGEKHGLSNNKFYRIWSDMLRRCNNYKTAGYENYGGRGITVYKDWLDVRNFIAWAESTYIEGYTLDRIDNNGSYEPSNCRWADKTTQNINQRMKKNNTSGYVGVAWNKTHQLWVSYIHLDKKRHDVGTFKDKMEAIIARDNYIIENGLPHPISSLSVKEKPNE